MSTNKASRPPVVRRTPAAAGVASVYFAPPRQAELAAIAAELLRHVGR